MLKTKLAFVFLSASACVHAQQITSADATQKMIDSIIEARIDEAALLYPRIRQFSITHQQNFAGDMQSKLHGKDFFKGRFQSARTAINFNTPIVNYKANTLVASIGVVHQFFDLNNVFSYDPQQKISGNTSYMPMINLGLSFTHRDTLFGRQFGFTAGVNSLSNPSFGRRQFNFLGLITTPFISKPNTRLTGGLVVSIDPSSLVPVIPFISYFHHFKAADIDLMIDLPYRLAVRKPMLKNNASITVFSELAGSNSFIDLESPSPTFPQKLTFALLEIKSGLLFEYRITKKIVLSASGGASITAKSNILEQGARPNDYFISNKNTVVPYAQIGFSLLPFWKGIFR